MYSYLNKINENTNGSISILLQMVIWACVHTLSDQYGENESEPQVGLSVVNEA